MEFPSNGSTEDDAIKDTQIEIKGATLSTISCLIVEWINKLACRDH